MGKYLIGATIIMTALVFLLLTGVIHEDFKMLRSTNVTTELTSITYNEFEKEGISYAGLININNPALSPVWATKDQISLLQVGNVYSFTIETWTEGWGPKYILKSVDTVTDSFNR